MAAIFGKTNFFENWHGYSAEIACRSKILSKSLYLARFSRYKHFYVLQLCEKFENSKWPPIFARKFFWENWHGYSAEIKILSKSLYLARFSRYKHFYVLQFCEKFKNSKWPPFFARNFFFENWHGYSAEIPCGSKISSKSLYLARFSRHKHFYVLQFCEKFENSKWPPFLARNFFFENWHGNSAEIPCGSKISSKLLYLARFSRYKHFYVLQFCEKFENSKWPPFLARQIFFFENRHGYSAEIPCGSKISLKSLYLAVTVTGKRGSNYRLSLSCNRKSKKLNLTNLFDSQ